MVTKQTVSLIAFGIQIFSVRFLQPLEICNLGFVLFCSVLSCSVLLQSLAIMAAAKAGP